MRAALASLVRRRTEATGARRELTEQERRLLPPGFDAVGEALVSGWDPVAACAEVGRSSARDGASLGEALSGLCATYAAVAQGAPDFPAVEALALGWSDVTLEFLHEVTCEDPLTGLATVPHLRTRLAELYRAAARGGEGVASAHALLVVDLSAAGVPAGPHGAFSRALRLAGVADVLRGAFTGDETIARAGSDRLVALVRRTPGLGRAVGATRELLAEVEPSAQARVWVEGLPAEPALVMPLLHELCS